MISGSSHSALAFVHEVQILLVTHFHVIQQTHKLLYTRTLILAATYTHLPHAYIS